MNVYKYFTIPLCRYLHQNTHNFCLCGCQSNSETAKILINYKKGKWKPDKVKPLALKLNTLA